MTTGEVRASAGVRVDWLDLRAGVVLVPVLVSTGAGDATVLAGGGASARAVVPVSPLLRAVVAAGLDVFATTTEYRLAGMSVLTTPRWAPWLAAGIEVAL